MRGDVRDQALLERALGEYEIDTVFHLAAQTIVGDRQPQPGLDVRDEHRGHLGAARGLPAQPDASSRSSSRRPTRPTATRSSCPTTRTTPLQGRHPYDVSKSCADLIAQAYADTYGLPVAITRCGNFYGGGDLNWNRIVPGTIRSVLRGERPVIRSDGTVRPRLLLRRGRRRGLHAAGRARCTRGPSCAGEAFNFSNEIQVTVLDLVALILERWAATSSRTSATRRATRSAHQYLERRQGARDARLAPLFDLDEGLERTIAWYREFLGAMSAEPHGRELAGRREILELVAEYHDARVPARAVRARRVAGARRRPGLRRERAAVSWSTPSLDFWLTTGPLRRRRSSASSRASSACATRCSSTPARRRTCSRSRA